jgi:hypothetical protein
MTPSQVQAPSSVQLPAPVLAASGMLVEGVIHSAEGVLRKFLARRPQHIEALRLLAEIAVACLSAGQPTASTLRGRLWHGRPQL